MALERVVAYYSVNLGVRAKEITAIDTTLRGLKGQFGGDRTHPRYKELAFDLIKRRHELSGEQFCDKRSLTATERERREKKIGHRLCV